MKSHFNLKTLVIVSLSWLMSTAKACCSGNEHVEENPLKFGGQMKGLDGVQSHSAHGHITTGVGGSPKTPRIPSGCGSRPISHGNHTNGNGGEGFSLEGVSRVPINPPKVIASPNATLGVRSCHQDRASRIVHPNGPKETRAAAQRGFQVQSKNLPMTYPALSQVVMGVEGIRNCSRESVWE